MRQSWAVNDLIGFVVNSARTAPADDAPFHHLRFERVFPDDFYGEMLEAMPVAEDYRAMSGKSKMGGSRADGKPTRTKIDLFPEYTRHLPPEKREVWDVAGRVLRSKRSEEHTSELQSQSNLVCRLLLEKKKTQSNPSSRHINEDTHWTPPI